MNNLDLNYLSNIIRTCIKKLKDLKEENARLNKELKEEKNKKKEAIKLIDKIEEELKKRL
jgi:predicted ATP-binding protein involved in virulence